MKKPRITLKTPGVYIEEKNAFPNAIVGVETAVPAFIGYTEKAEFKGQSLKNKPVRVNSLIEFEDFFGKGAEAIYAITEVQNPSETNLHIQDKTYRIGSEAGARFNLYESIKFFYQNGGGSCCIVSVGTYKNGNVEPEFTVTPFIKGIKLLEKEVEPTMLVIPEAILFEEEDCYSIQNSMIDHCGQMMNRVAILDIHSGDKGLDDPTFNPVENFRDKISSDHLSYAAAYYPWLHTSIVQSSEVSYKNLNSSSLNSLKEICQTSTEQTLNDAQIEALQPYLNELTSDTASTDAKLTPEIIHKTLMNSIPEYKTIMEAILKQKNLLPPSPAIAGIYSLADAQRGVWKAPANVALSSVVTPSVIIDHNQQEDLNAPILGKAICAIRAFPGLGTMVWGARTLDANSLDWRYINVRRTMIMIEQSIKMATRAYVFEPNDQNTWVSVESMISNFLTNLWKQGALAGAVPADAFSVNVGLGSTMTSNDILEGIMNVTVKVAVSHPAEFIVITFQQQMQKS